MSGVSIHKLISIKYNDKKLIKKFYVNRISKIYPTYLVMIAIILLTYHFSGVPSEIYETMSDFSFRRIDNIIENCLIVPIAYLDQFKNLRSFLLIQPAWALGIEVLFYLIYPFIYFYDNENKNDNAKIILTILSLTIFSLGCFGIMNTSTFTYFGLSGTLFLFLIGAILSKEFLTRKDYLILLSVEVYGVILFISLNLFNQEQFRLVKNQLVGIILGVIVIYLLRSFNYSAVDRFLARISYNIYICHAFIIAILGSPINIVNATIQQRVERSIWIFLCTFILAFILFYIVKVLHILKVHIIRGINSLV